MDTILALVIGVVLDLSIMLGLLELHNCIHSYWLMMFPWTCTLNLYILVLLSVVRLEAMMLEQLDPKLVLLSFSFVVVHVRFLWSWMTCLDVGLLCIALVVYVFSLCITILIMHCLDIMHKEWEGWNGFPVVLIWYYFRRLYGWICIKVLLGFISLGSYILWTRYFKVSRMYFFLLEIMRGI